jgi:hypothetical protein
MNSLITRIRTRRTVGGWRDCRPGELGCVGTAPRHEQYFIVTTSNRAVVVPTYIQNILEDAVSEVGSNPSPDAEFERFVYADIATESNGMELSVLSALSRRGLDPWQEAKRLAQLPRSAAADGLAQILRLVPAIQSLHLDVAMIAERLVGLLPVRSAVAAGQLRAKLGGAPVQLPRGLIMAMAAAIFGAMLVPLFMPRQSDPIAPASWIADGPKAPVEPQPIPGQSTVPAVSDHPEPAGVTTARPSAL